MLELGKKAAASLAVSCLRPQPWSQRRRTAIYKPDGIGDFVLTSAALGMVIAEHGPENVSLVVSRHVADLATLLFPRVQILPITPGHDGWQAKIRGLPALRRALRGAVCDEVLCLRHYRNLYDTVILESMAASRVVLLQNQTESGNTCASRPISGNFHVVEFSDAGQPDNTVPRELRFHAAVLSASLGRRVESAALRPDWDALRPRRTGSRPFLLVSPLAGNRIRDLPPQLVDAAARSAAAKGLARVVLTGSRGQAGRLALYAERLRAALPGLAVEVAHPTSLPDLVALVASASLVVAAETSTAHIATALDQPALLLIGGGHFGWFAPWNRSARQVWLSNQLPCFGCSWRCIYSKPLCITEITPDDVSAALPPARTGG